jgi:hypothetical protein
MTKDVAKGQVEDMEAEEVEEATMKEITNSKNTEKPLTQE